MVNLQKFNKKYIGFSIRRILLYVISSFPNEIVFSLTLLLYNIIWIIFIWIIYTVNQASPLLILKMFHALFALTYSTILVIYISEKHHLRYIPYLYFISIVILVSLYVSLLLLVPSTTLIVAVPIFLLITLFLLLCDIVCIKLTKRLSHPEKHRLIEIIKNYSKEKHRL